MFHWSTVHVMDAYLDHVCIRVDENNKSRENVPPKITLPYHKIYPIIVPGIVRYVNTSKFILVFFGAVHALESNFKPYPSQH